MIRLDDNFAIFLHDAVRDQEARLTVIKEARPAQWWEWRRWLTRHTNIAKCEASIEVLHTVRRRFKYLRKAELDRVQAELAAAFRSRA